MPVTDLRDALAVASTTGWFSTRSPATRGKLSKIARLQRFAAGQVIYRFGDSGDGIFGLVDGSFEITVPRADGVDFTAFRADPGFWIGDLAQFAGQTRLVTLVAAAPTQVIFLPDAELRQLLNADPRLFADFYELSHLNMALAIRLLANLAIAPSDARIAVRLLMHYETRNPGTEGLQLSQGKLAELVALSVPTVERVLRRFQDSGIVDLGYGSIRILDRNALRALVYPDRQS